MSPRRQTLDNLIAENEIRATTIEQASQWASSKFNKNISKSNIAYLVQYGHIEKFTENGVTLIKLDDLHNYYSNQLGRRETDWKNRLGDDLNWSLSFEHLREIDTTKHVHRLHPYKGKFIPQLVQYFLDDHIDEFKTGMYFSPGDVVLDPFAGSGTTLVQAGELGIHSVGIDISSFNCMITDVKTGSYDFLELHNEIKRVQAKLSRYCADNPNSDFEFELSEQISQFNKKFFPNPKFRRQVKQGEINESEYGAEQLVEFAKIEKQVINKFGIRLLQTKSETFLDKWYCQNARSEIDFVNRQIQLSENLSIRQVLQLILSRTIRSCRATTHFDLATLKEPQFSAYYCWKHKKICKPVYSIKYWFDRYSKDTIARLQTYSQVKGEVFSTVLTGDSRSIDIFSEVNRRDTEFFKFLRSNRIKGIFSSPPYVGQIDYHEQHAYAYELLGLERNDENEIGPLYKGKGRAARESYVEGISDVLLNCREYLTNDANIFLVANDKHNLYPSIAERSGMKIVNAFKRPVLNRTERDKSPYAEMIFRLQFNR